MLLWGLYGFRFRESGEAGDTFNRPLASKLEDVGSPLVREALRAAETWRLLPRPYVWGLADVTRSAVEGRSFPSLRVRGAPVDDAGLVLPGDPRGEAPSRPSGALDRRSRLGRGGAGGAGLVARTRFSPLGLAGAAFLATLAVSRAGLRRRPARPAGLPGARGSRGCRGGGPRDARPPGPRRRRGPLRGRGVPALLVPRPWEFHNVLAGGTARRLEALQQRRGSTSASAPSSSPDTSGRCSGRRRESSLTSSTRWRPSRVARLGLRAAPGGARDGSGTLTGTFLVSAVEVAPSRAWDYEPFRRVEPVDRRGNLLVYRGTFRLPWLRARDSTSRGCPSRTARGGTPRRPATGSPRRRASIRALCVSALELGNLEMELGRPEGGGHGVGGGPGGRARGRRRACAPR